MLRALFSISLLGVVADTDGLQFVSQCWKVPNAPPIIPPLKFINIGTTLKISCQTDDPYAKVDLHVSKGSGRKNMVEWNPTRVTKDGQTFTIRNIRMGDGAKYFCMARTDRELVELKKGRLIVRNIRPNLIPEVYPNKKRIDVERRGQYTIVCKMMGGPKGIKSYLSWSFKPDGRKSAVKVDPSMIESSKRMVGGNHIDIDKLVFKNFSLNDSGEYTCRRKIPSEENMTSKTVQVMMKADETPRVKVSALNLKPRENETTILRCDATGSPKPKRFWKTKAGRIIQCEDNNRPCLYVIPRVQFPKDDGIATCTAVNDVGEDVQRILIKVQVPVEFKRHYRSSVIARSDEQVELNMDVLRGNPPPKITWYQHKCKSKWNCHLKDCSWIEVLNQNPNNGTETMRSFIVTPKTSSDYWYRVVASNPTGTTNFTFQLIRKDHHIPQFAILPDVKVHELLTHEYLTLKCVIDANVYSNVKITKDGVNLRYNGRIEGHSMVFVYRKEDVQTIDSGIYECFARSKRDRSKVRKRSIRVKVRTEESALKGTNKKVVKSQSVQELKEKIERLTQELSDLRRFIKDHIVYVSGADGDKMAAKQFYKKFNASFVGIGTGLDSLGNDASATSSTVFVYKTLPDCLEHCADTLLDETAINGVRYNPEDGECKCERNFVSHKSGRNQLHYRLE